MDILNFFNYLNYLHQEHMKLKQTYETLLSIVLQELPEIKARVKTSVKQNIQNVQKETLHPENIIVCQFCGENFNEQWKLETHLVIHEEAEKFPCDICDKIFQTKWRLAKHLKNHERKHVKICKYFKKGQFCPFEKVGCKFSHSFPKAKNEKEQIPNDTSNNNTTMGENAENKADHVSKSDCQGCGQFIYEFECVECNGRFCSECINKDHTKNVHYCLNCEDDVDFENDVV